MLSLAHKTNYLGKPAAVLILTAIFVFFSLILPVESQAQQSTNTQIPATQDNLNTYCRIVPSGQTPTIFGISLPGLPDPLFEVPFEQQLTSFWLPGLLILYLANLLWAVPFISLVRFLQWLILEPFLGLFRRKRRGYGVVFESLSKRPVDLALVRLIDTNTNKVIATRVTNRNGQFSMIEPPGDYRLIAAKQNYAYPSKFLAGEKEDVNYGLITTGGSFKHETSGTIEMNIPLDSPEDKISIQAALRRRTKQIFQGIVAYAGLLLSAASLMLLWNRLALIFFVVHVLLFFLFFRLTDKFYGRPWGMVFDLRSRDNLGKSVVRILDKKYKRVLETQVADNSGLYGFLVGQNEFYLEALQPGYNKLTTEPFKVKSRPGIVAKDLGLRQGSSPQAFST